MWCSLARPFYISLRELVHKEDEIIGCQKYKNETLIGTRIHMPLSTTQELEILVPGKLSGYVIENIV